MTNVNGWRAMMALIGGLAGLGLWALWRLADGVVLPERALLALAALTCAFFAGLLAMAGPLSPARAAVRAAAVAGVATAFLVLASFRFREVGALVDSPHVLTAFFAMVLVPLPFCIAGRSYDGLFLHAWGIVVRYLSALLFTGLFWAVAMLSDALLGIVGIHWIGALLDRAGAAMVLTGVVFGLAIAVADELRGHVSPLLVLRLLRLLVPVMLAVLVVFILGLPARGLSGVFGGLSAAGTLLAICVAVATLVTVAVDRDDTHAVTVRLSAWSARALAVILPVPAALALWAVALRVADYGWTPDRVASVTAAGVALVYGLTYLLAALRRGWMARIRQANIVLALGLIALAALWQTPLLDAQRIAARDQADRIRAGQVDDPAAVPFDAWGRAGAAARADLGPLLPEPMEEPPLERTLSIRPEGEGGAILSALPEATRRNWTSACAAILPDGRPACVLVVGPFAPDLGGVQALFLSERQGQADVQAVHVQEGRFDTLLVDHPWEVQAGDVARLLDGPLEFRPVPRNRLMLGDRGLAID